MDAYIAATLSEIDRLKTELGKLRPLPTDALKKIQDALAIEYTYESNRIEGNTLTLQETALVVNEGVTISGKSMREHLEVINHAQAIEFIKDIAKEHLLSKGYVIVNLKGDNDSKIAYYAALEKSHVQGDRTDFYRLVADNEKEALTRYLRIIQG